MAILNFAKKKNVKKKVKAKSRAPKKAVKKNVRKKTPKRKIIKAGAKRKVVRKTTVKKAVKVRKPSLAKNVPIANEEIIGAVTHYFPKVRAAVVKITKGGLSLGDKIHIKGHSSDFTQAVDSMQIEHSPINTAKRGDEIGLMVSSRARTGDIVYKIK